MKYQTLTEGKVRIRVPVDDVVSKRLPVFYNPVMKLNRDITLLLLKAWPNNNLSYADILAGSGVRALRLMKELPARKIREVLVNDGSKDAVKSIRANIVLNKLLSAQKKKLVISNKDANDVLLQSKGCDVIDIDPFGSPNMFLDAAVKRVARDGLLCVTATDTSALAGTFPNACMRKYWGVPLRNEFMHEVGLRLLIRKVQLVGAQFEKALVPVFSLSQDHYYRVFFRVIKGKSVVDDVVRQHVCLWYDKKMLAWGMSKNAMTEEGMLVAGPLWCGSLWDVELVRRMVKEVRNDVKLSKLLSRIAGEADIPVVGFFDVHAWCKLLKREVPKMEVILAVVRQQGYTAAVSHINEVGVRTTMPVNDFKNLLKNLP